MRGVVGGRERPFKKIRRTFGCVLIKADQKKFEAPPPHPPPPCLAALARARACVGACACARMGGRVCARVRGIRSVLGAGVGVGVERGQRIKGLICL